MPIGTQFFDALNLKGAWLFPHSLELNEDNEWPQPEHAVGVARDSGWGELENLDEVIFRPLHHSILNVVLKLEHTSSAELARRVRGD